MVLVTDQCDMTRALFDPYIIQRLPWDDVIFAVVCVVDHAVQAKQQIGFFTQGVEGIGDHGHHPTQHEQGPES